MSSKLFATQITAVTLGVIGAGLMMRAFDKGTKLNPNKRALVFEKLSRFTDRVPNLE